MTRIKPFVPGALILALVTTQPGLAQNGASSHAGDVHVTQMANENTASASQNGGEDVWSMFPAELKAGTLSAADNERLNDLAIENVQRLEVKWKREFGRSMAGLEGNLGKLDQVIADYKRDRASHSNKMTSENLVNLIADGLPELIDQLALPAHSQITVMLGDVTELVRTVVTARSNMAGADPKKIATMMQATYDFDRRLGSFLYQARDTLERVSTIFREMTPAQRIAAAGKIQAAIDRGDITYDDDGNFKVNKPTPTPTPPDPAPTPANSGPATGPGTTSAPGPTTDASTAGPATNTDTPASTEPTASAAPRPVRRGVIPGASDDSVLIPQATQDAYAQYQAAQAAAQREAAQQAARQAQQAQQPPPPEPPVQQQRPVQPVILVPVRTTGDTSGNQPFNSSDPNPTTPQQGLDPDAIRRNQLRLEILRNNGDQATDTINFLSLTSLFSDDPELVSALTVAWPQDSADATIGGGNSGISGGLDSTGTLADQSGYDAFGTGPYSNPGGYGGALATGPYTAQGASAPAGWSSFDASSPVTVANLEPIYAGYDVNQQPGAAMQSLDLHAPAPTAVMTVPSTQVQLPSTQVQLPSPVMGPGTLPGASPAPAPALCGR